MIYRSIVIALVALAMLIQPAKLAGAAQKKSPSKTAPVKAAAVVKTKQSEEEKLASKLADFEAYAVKAMADWKVPGMAIAIVRVDNVIYQKAFGVKELGKDAPVTTDTVFQIGSTSKAFTAALIATLVDEGKLKWDDKVTAYLDDFKMYDPWVTGEFMVTDLMAQRSGMAPHAIDSLVMMGFGRDRVIDSLRYVKPATSFRSAYAYQNNLWLVAAKIAEKITGKTWEENIKERIFRPLGMNASSSDLKSFTRGEDVASLHHDVDGKIVVLPMDWPYIDWTYTYGPAGGINANVKDVSKWLRMQAQSGLFKTERIIKDQSVKFMHLPKTVIAGSTDPIQYYCLGWVHREADPYPITWHNGGTSGSKTMIAFVPQAKLGIVVLSNLIESELPESLAWRFFDIYFGNPKRDWSATALDKAKKAVEKAKLEEPKEPAAPKPAMALDRYTGDYSNDIYGSAVVTKKDDFLILTVGPKKLQADLRHWDSNKFLGSWKYFGVKEDVGFVTFSTGADGAVTGMVADVFNEDGCGTFQKSGVAAAGEKALGRDRVVIEGMTVTREKEPQGSAKPAVSCEFDKIYGEAVAIDGVKQMTYEQFMRLCNSNDKYVLVDVLSSDDYNTGHIPGAISFPVKNINFYNSVNKIPMGSNVVVYCLDLRCPYSAEAAKKLKGYGYKVLAYKGGLDEWRQKGQPLAR